MEDARFDAERPERAHAADAEDDFLLDARLPIAPVQTRGQLAVPRGVLFEIGVEEIELHAPDAYPPHRHQHRPIVERNGREARLAVGGRRLLDRSVLPVEQLVALFLPSFRRHVLMEVALRIHEPDADERHAEVAGLLAVIAGQHAKAARVNRQRLMERELG